jgi:hypothetical protein
MFFTTNGGDGDADVGGAEFSPYAGANCRKAVTETVTVSDSALRIARAGTVVRLKATTG